MPPALARRLNANGIQPKPDIESATNAMGAVSLSKKPPLGGLAARRAALASNAPRMTLAQILPNDSSSPFPGGGATGAGLRPGRPDMNDNPRRQPTGGTPFSNFGKIVYVSSRS